MDKWMVLSLACLVGGIALVALEEMGWAGTLLGAFVASLLPQPRPVRREIERLSRRPPPPPPGPTIGPNTPPPSDRTPVPPPGSPPTPPTGTPPATPPAATLLVVLGATAVAGCCMTGCGAQSTADTAHASACVAVQRESQREHEDGSLTYEEATARVQCTRAVCDRIEQAMGE